MKNTFDQKYIIDELNKQERWFGNDNIEIDLILEYGVLADNALEILRNYPILKKLVILHCGNVHDADLAFLADLNKLKKLFIAGTNCDGSFLQYVNPDVHYLQFKYSHLERSNARFLERFANIGQIDLEDCGVDDSVVDALTCQSLNQLRRIDLYNGRFQKQTERKLVAPNLNSITVVNGLGCANITNIFRETQQLSHVDLRYSDFPEDSIIQLLEHAENSNEYLHIDLSGTSASDRTIEFIASSNLQNINFLYLDGTRVTQNGVRTLAKSKHSKDIFKLGLTDIDDVDLSLVISSFPDLYEVQVPYSALSKCNIPSRKLRLETETPRVAIYSVKRKDIQIVFLKTTYEYHHKLVCRANRYHI